MPAATSTASGTVSGAKNRPPHWTAPPSGYCVARIAPTNSSDVTDSRANRRQSSDQAATTPTSRIGHAMNMPRMARSTIQMTRNTNATVSTSIPTCHRGSQPGSRRTTCTAATAVPSSARNTSIAAARPSTSSIERIAPWNRASRKPDASTPPPVLADSVSDPVPTMDRTQRSSAL